MVCVIGQLEEMQAGCSDCLSALQLPRVKHSTHLMGRAPNPMVIKDLWPMHGDVAEFSALFAAAGLEKAKRAGKES